MARTIRRKNASCSNGFYYRHLQPQDITCWDLKKYNTDDPSRAIMLKRVRYHRDRGRGQYGVPSWFRRMYRHVPERRGTRQVIHRAIRQDEWEDFLDPRIPSNASWYWW